MKHSAATYPFGKSQSPVDVGLTAAVSGALLIAGIGYGVAQSIGDEHRTALALLGLSLLCFTFLTLYSIASRDIGLLTITAGLYHSIFLIFPGMIHAARGQFPFYAMRYSDGSVTEAAAVVLLYSVGLVAGYGMRCSARRRDLMRRMAPVTQVGIDPAKVVALTLASALITVGCVFVVGVNLFTRHNYYEQVDLPTELTPQTLAVLYLPRMLMFLNTCVSAKCVAERPTACRIVNLAIALSITLFVDNPFVIPRFDLFAFALIALVLFAPSSSAVGKTALIAGGVGAVTTLFPYVDFLRRGDSVGGFVYDPIGYYTSNGDFDGLQSIVNIVEAAEAKGFSFGFQLLGATLSFIPRTLWESKPYATGQAAAQFVGYDFTNISAPLPGELFIDFGWPGVAILAALVGWTVRNIDEHLAVAKMRNNFASLLMYGGIVGFSTIVFRGSLLAISSQVYLYFIVAAAVNRWVVWGPQATPRASVESDSPRC